MMLADHTQEAASSHRFAEVALGSHAAFATLYDEVAPMVHGIATQAARTPAEADAITAQVFVCLWRHAARFGGTDVCRIASAIAARATRFEVYDSPSRAAPADRPRAQLVPGMVKAPIVSAFAGHDGHQTLI